MLLAVLKKRKKATPYEKLSTTTQKDLDCNLLVVMALMRILQTLTKTDVNMDNPSTSTTPATANKIHLQY